MPPTSGAGVGLIRGGCATALVGSPENVVARMREYQQAGIDEFIFSGYPHLEECFRAAELLFPLLKRDTEPSLPQKPSVQHKGEVIALNYIPDPVKATSTKGNSVLELSAGASAR